MDARERGEKTMRRNNIKMAAIRLRMLCRNRLDRMGPEPPFDLASMLDYCGSPEHERRLAHQESIRRLSLVIAGCDVEPASTGWLRDDLTTQSLDARMERIAAYLPAA